MPRTDKPSLADSIRLRLRTEDLTQANQYADRLGMHRADLYRLLFVLGLGQLERNLDPMKNMSEEAWAAYFRASGASLPKEFNDLLKRMLEAGVSQLMAIQEVPPASQK